MMDSLNAQAGFLSETYAYINIYAFLFRLSEKILLIADDLDRNQTLIVAEKMQEVQYRNPLLIQK